jgi:PST family polysaccharide transporter
MNLARTGLYTGIATAARLAAALVVVKLVAVLAGPEGVGKLGQFVSLMSLLAVLAGGGIGPGIVKYVAEYREDAQRLARLLGTALCYALCAACAMAAAALLLREPIATWLLGDARYVTLICVLAVAQIGIAIANYFLAVINGFMDVRRLALVQVLGSVFSTLLVVALAHPFGLPGALLGMVLGQSLWVVVGLPAWSVGRYFSTGLPRLRFDPEMTRRLAAFSVMTLTSALLPPLVNIAVRDHLAAQFGWADVGYWQAVSRVSDAYLLFITSAINIYYLPKLAATQGRAALILELRQGFRVLMPVVAVSALVIYVAREWITQLLFNAGFAPANALYGPQLIGDVLKIASFVLSYLMLAKAMTRLFVASECIFAATYLVLVYAFTARFGVVGAIYAFTANYVLYLAFNLLVARRYLGRLG